MLHDLLTARMQDMAMRSTGKSKRGQVALRTMHLFYTVTTEKEEREVMHGKRLDNNPKSSESRSTHGFRMAHRR